MEFKSEFGQHQLGKFRLSVTNAKDPLGSAAMPASVRKALSIALDNRTPAQQAQVRDYFRNNVSTTLKPIRERLASLCKDQSQAEATERTTMVMEEMAKPRDTFVLMRGQYDKPGDKVTAGVPKSLPPLPAGAPHNRLGLAQWLVSPAQPLTARVAVNRYWQTLLRHRHRQDGRGFRLAGRAAHATQSCSTGWPCEFSGSDRSQDAQTGT